MAADYQIYYITVPINDLDNKEYGYVVMSGYLLNEVTRADGTKSFEVVPVKNIEALNIENYVALDSQVPEFDEGRCVNSIEVESIYQIYDEAQEAAKEKSLKVFEKCAKEKSYSKIDTVRDLYAYKRITDETLAMIKNEREITLSEIEKGINHQKKRY